MPFHFTCPYCFKTTLVADDLAGQQGPCAGCGKFVKIPPAPAKPAVQTRPVGSSYVESQPASAKRRLTHRALQVMALIAVVTGVSAFATFMLWPTIETLRQRRDKVACVNNLQRIAMALNAYAAEHGTYPPPVVFDEQGKPLYSWRVLILPQLGYPALYARYNFAEAWDSQANSALIPNCPREFISPAARNAASSDSSYVLVTGQGTLFPSTGPLSQRDILDGPETTLLVVETKNTTQEWTKPYDIDFSKLNPSIGATGPNTIGGNHAGGAAAVFADGSPAWLPSDLDPTLLDSVISPQGGEPVNPKYFRLK